MGRHRMMPIEGCIAGRIARPVGRAALAALGRPVVQLDDITGGGCARRGVHFAVRRTWRCTITTRIIVQSSAGANRHRERTPAAHRRSRIQDGGGRAPQWRLELRAVVRALDHVLGASTRLNRSARAIVSLTGRACRV